MYESRPSFSASSFRSSHRHTFRHSDSFQLSPESLRRRHDDVIKRALPSCAKKLRKELHWRMMGLGEKNPTKFATTAWLKKQHPYAVFRFVCFAHAVACLSWAAYKEATRTEEPENPWLLALPTWNFILYTLYHTLALIFTVMEFFHDCLCNDDLSWYHKIAWMLQTTVFNGSLTCFACSIIYVIAQSTGDVAAQDWFAPLASDDINYYVITAVVMLIDVIASSVSVRLLHVIYPTIFYLCFFTFHIYRWAAGFTPHLVALDYGGAKQDTAIPLVFTTLLVICPAAHVTAYALDTLRWRLVVTCLERHRRRVVDLVAACERTATFNGGYSRDVAYRLERRRGLATRDLATPGRFSVHLEASVE